MLNNEKTNNLEKESKVMRPEVKKVRDGIMRAPSRTYGERIMEPIFRYKYGWDETETDENDAVCKSNKFKEIKCTKVLTPHKRKKTSLLEEVNGFAEKDVLSRMISFNDGHDSAYDCNVQNVKRDHFDQVLYAMLFEDCIKVFECDSDDVSNIVNWSGKHGRYDEEGKSGQFAVKKNNLQWHLDNNFKETVTWEEVYEIVNELSNDN